LKNPEKDCVCETVARIFEFFGKFPAELLISDAAAGICCLWLFRD
jgi:hypothetical protein